METYNKLISIGKSTEKDISNLKIEDLENKFSTFKTEAENRISELIKEINLKNENISELSENKGKLENDICLKNQEIRSLEDENKKLNNEISSKNIKISNLEIEKTSLSERLSEFKDL